MNISIIVPTLDRALSLDRLLHTISYQKLENSSFEVLVIDNGSVDNTKLVCEAYEAKIPNFRYFFEPEKALHIARHVGLKNSIGRILIFLDDDVTLSDDFLLNINKNFEFDESIVLVGGKILPVWEGEVPFWLWYLWNRVDGDGQKVLSHLSLVDLGDEIRYIDPKLIFGCNFSIRRNVLVEAQGFHPDSMPQDRIMYRGDGETYISDFISKHPSYKALYDPSTSVHHHIPVERMSYDYFRKRSFNEGISNSFKKIRETPQELSYGFFYRHKLARIKRNIKLFFGIELMHKLEHIEKYEKMLPIEKIMYKYANLGFEFHQNYYNKCEELRRWVHQENFL